MVDYAQIISDHYDTLLRAIDPTTNLVNRLRIKKVISKEDAEKIKIEQSNGEKIESLLMLLMDAASTDRKDACFGALVKALRDSGQEHVANLFDVTSEQTTLGRQPMSEAHCKVLSGKLGKISEVLDPECGIVEMLFSEDVFTEADQERISSCSTYDAKAGEIVRKLLRKPDGAYLSFMEALHKTGQDHVVYVIAGGGKPPVREEFLNNMRKQRTHIVDCMEPKHSGLLDMLVSFDVINARDYDRIDPPPSPGLQPTTEYDMNIALLRLLPRRPQESFDKFIVALVATQQSKVAQLFVGEEVNGKMKIIFKCGADEAQKGNANDYMILELAKLLGDGIQLKSDLLRVLVGNDVTISYVKEGCIAIGFRCHTVEALQNLRELQQRKELDRIFTEAYSSGLAEYGGVSLSLEITEEELSRCETNFEDNQLMTPVHRQALLLAAKSPSVLEQVTVSDELLDHLSLCDRRKRAVKSSTGTRKAATLFEIVSRQPDWAFDKLLYALRQTNQTKVVDFLLVPSMRHSLDAKSAPVTSADLLMRRVAGSGSRNSESEQSETESKGDDTESQTKSKTEPPSTASSLDAQHKTDLIKTQRKHISDLENKQKKQAVKLSQAEERNKALEQQLKTAKKKENELTAQLRQALANVQRQISERNTWLAQSEAIMGGVMQQLQGAILPVAQFHQQLQLLGTQRQPTTLAGYNLKEAEQKQDSIVPRHFDTMPTELLEMILLKAFMRLFRSTPVFSATGSISVSGMPVVFNWGSGIIPEGDRLCMASVTCYMTLANVCNVWHQTIIGWPDSPTRHWFKHQTRRALKGYVDRSAAVQLNLVRDALPELMEPDYGLLEELLGIGFLSRQDYSRLQSEPVSTQQRNAVIIQSLYAVFTEQRCRMFIHALQQADQQHVVNYIRCRGGVSPNFGDVRPLDKACITRLDTNRRRLIELINADNSFIERLIDARCINVQQRSALMSIKGPSHERIRKLLDILSRRSVADFNNFIRCLIDSHQAHVAELLGASAETLGSESKSTHR